MFAMLTKLFGSSNDSMDSKVVGDSNAVLEAVMQRSGDNNRFVVVLGEPRLVDYGGPYSENYKVEIPTETQEGDPNPPEIVYDLPEDDMGGDNDSGLYKLLNAYDIEVLADLGDLEGETVMGTLRDGTFSMDFSQLVE